jgi:hypothetical protein
VLLLLAACCQQHYLLHSMSHHSSRLPGADAVGPKVICRVGQVAWDRNSNAASRHNHSCCLLLPPVAAAASSCCCCCCSLLLLPSQVVYGHLDDPEHQELQRGVSYLKLRPGARGVLGGWVGAWVGGWVVVVGGLGGGDGEVCGSSKVSATSNSGQVRGFGGWG